MYVAPFKPKRRITILNTYTDKQVNNALAILSEVFEDQPEYLALPNDSKERFAEIVLRAFQIEPKSGE